MIARDADEPIRRAVAVNGALKNAYVIAISIACVLLFHTRQAAPAEPSDDVASASEGITTEDPWSGVEEMVVVGNDMAGALFESTVSVTGFSQEDLVAIGAVNVSDISEYTPNLEIRTFSGTTPTFFIRGVGLNDFTANASGAIAIYQDDIALNLPAIQLGQLFDTEAVNVLRGPQGSGSGRNASGGAIKIYSRRPTGETGGYLRASYGRFNSIDVEGALEVPIVETLSARFAFRFSQRDPIVENGCGNVPPIGLDRVQFPNRRGQNGVCGETGFVPVNVPNPNPPPNQYAVSPLPTGLATKLNDRESWAARGLLRWAPDGLPLEMLLNLHGSRVDQLGTAGQVIGTSGYFGGQAGLRNRYRPPEIESEEAEIQARLIAAGKPLAEAQEEARSIVGRRLARGNDTRPFRGDYNRDGRERQTAMGASLRVEIEFGNLDVTSITGVESYDRERRSDADYTPNVIFENEADDKAWQLTQELNVSGTLENIRADWEAGVFVLIERLDFDSRVDTTPPLLPLSRSFVQETTGVGIFLDSSWEVIEYLTLESGIRLNIEEKTFDVSLLRGTDPFGGAICVTRVVQGITLPGQDCSDSSSWVEPTGMASLQYAFTEDISGYLKYSRGWKSGQYNAGGASGRAVTLADPETVNAYELGLKASLFGGLLDLSGSLFFYQYKDYQVFLSQNDFGSPPQRIVLNANDAEVYGAEFEMDLRPIEGLTMNFRLGWLESEFLDFTQIQIRSIPSGSILDPPVVVPVVIDFTGNRLPNTPRFKLSASVDYQWVLGRLGQLTPRYDIIWTDDVFFDASDGRGSPNNQNEIFMPDFAIGQRGYVLQNIRLTYASPNNEVEVALWVRNLTDQTYKSLAFDASASAGLVGNIIADPRTYGLTVSLNW